MENSTESRTSRLLNRCLELALRFWPQESHHWGIALSAELSEISRPSEKFSWVIGGIFLFIRALSTRLLGWLSLPAGVGLSSSPSDRPRGLWGIPRVPRFIVGFLLLATFVIFFIPPGQEALSTMLAAWNDSQALNWDAHKFQKIEAKAKQEQDANTLAFVAFNESDPNHSIELMNQAVRLDPSLTWIFGCRRFWFFETTAAKPQETQFKQLLAYDPTNGYASLLNAGEEARRTSREAILNGNQGIRQLLWSDPDWISLMDRTFRATTYDSYADRYVRLMQDAWKQHPEISAISIASSLYARRVSEASQIYTYKEQLFRQAEALVSSGHDSQAAELLGQVSSFGERMANGHVTPAEKIVGFGISRDASEALSKIYANSGRADEAIAMSARAKQLQSKWDAIVVHRIFDSRGLPIGSRQATIMHFTCLTTILTGFLSLISLILVELRGGLLRGGRVIPTRTLGTFADYAPFVLLLSSIVFLIRFQPFARLSTQFRLSEASTQGIRPFLDAVLHLSSAPTILCINYQPYYDWLIVTAALFSLALYLLYRLIFHRKAAG